MRTLSLTLAILASGTAAWASDQPDYGSGDVLHPEYFGGMRFDFGTAPGIKKVTTSQSKDIDGNPDPQADGTSNLKAKQGYSAGISVYWDTSLAGGWGWVVSPGLFYRDVVGKSSEYRDTFTAAGFEIATGPSLTLGHLNMELQPYIGFAGCNLKQDANFNGFTGSRSTGTGNDRQGLGQLAVPVQLLPRPDRRLRALQCAVHRHVRAVGAGTDLRFAEDPGPGAGPHGLGDARLLVLITS